MATSARKVCEESKLILKRVMFRTWALAVANSHDQTTTTNTSRTRYARERNG